MTHNARVLEMRQLGLDVVDTSWSQGRMLDCSVRHRGTGRQVYVEIKNSWKDKLTDAEIKFRSGRLEACRVITCRQDVIALWEELR